MGQVGGEPVTFGLSLLWQTEDRPLNRVICAPHGRM